jgi:hypothetical protein
MCAFAVATAQRRPKAYSLQAAPVTIVKVAIFGGIRLELFDGLGKSAI